MFIFADTYKMASYRQQHAFKLLKYVHITKCGFPKSSHLGLSICIAIVQAMAVMFLLTLLNCT